MIDPQKVSLFGVPYKTTKGREYTLLWCMKSARRAEAAGFGPDCPPNTALVLVFWASLLYCHPKITQEEAEDVIDAEMFYGNLENLTLAIKAAQEKAMGGGKQEEVPPRALE